MKRCNLYTVQTRTQKSIKCSYLNCENSNEDPSIALFRFPKDSKKRESWLRNCGNRHLKYLAPDTLCSKYLCAEHFNSRYISRNSKKEMRLARTAVPRPFTIEENMRPPSPSTEEDEEEVETLEVSKPSKVYVRQPKKIVPETHKMDDEGSDHSDCKQSHYTKTLENIVQTLEKQVVKDRILIRNLRRKVAAQKRVKEDLRNEYPNETAKMFAMMQMKNDNSQWTDAEKKFCMKLYNFDLRGYKAYSEVMVLAPIPTVRSWLGISNNNSDTEYENTHEISDEEMDGSPAASDKSESLQSVEDAAMSTELSNIAKDPLQNYTETPDIKKEPLSTDVYNSKYTEENYNGMSDTVQYNIKEEFPNENMNMEISNDNELCTDIKEETEDFKDFKIDIEEHSIETTNLLL